ncbi:MAG: patatin-like phospholipase family protein [Campylobacterota bacterium]|nr:patatin-like phospholipase family protein [Campylobacterota bacterium]
MILKVLLVFILVFGFAFAQDRAKIALVLSGGGARGGAHVGVLKILEKNNIPIDLIVGTSMGSFVGGLYASGKTPQEIEELLVTTKWQDYITTDFNRADTPMRKKEIEYVYQGRLGVGINSKNELVLPTGVLKRQPMLSKFLKETQHVQDIKDFDEFPIPFRAVATNIKNGDAIVLKSGSLAKVIYASSSIPGGFQPINIDGIDLVDGGVSDNFPITIAKEMGADIIIAVDVSENFDEDLNVDSYFVVMGQLINILMRKNANESISMLKDTDILLTPDLDGFGGLDAEKYVSIIQRGVDVSEKFYEEKLKVLSLSDEEYEMYKHKHRYKVNSKFRVLDKIEIVNPTYLSDDSILQRLHLKVGNVIDEDRLRADLLHIYNMMIFDSVDYELKEENGENILLITTTPSWDNHGEIRFAIGLEDDFDGHSSYSLKFGYTMFGLNAYGGEWKNDFEIGRRKSAYTEIFQPLDPMQRYYIRPSVEYTELLDLVPINEYSDEFYGNQELGIRRYGSSIAFGAHVTTDYEFEIGASIYKDKVIMEFIQYVQNTDARPIYASLKTDNLDNIHFPNVGVMSQILWTKEMESFGSDYDYEQIYFEIEKPFSFYSNNLTAFFKYGDTYNKKTATSLAGSYTLGGLFNLSGFPPYSLNDDNMALGLLKYRYEIKDGGFFGTLNTPLYAGFSVEIGNTWSEGESPTYDMMQKAGTVYVAADTFLGPFYLAYGITNTSHQSFYLYLGDKF